MWSSHCNQHVLDHIWILHLALGSWYKSNIEKLEGVQRRPLRCLGAETLALWGEAKRASLFQPGEETSSCRPSSNLLEPIGRSSRRCSQVQNKRKHTRNKRGSDCKEEKLFFPLKQSSSVRVKKLCCLCYCRFQDITEESPEQPGLISYLTLLWAGGWIETFWGTLQCELSDWPMQDLDELPYSVDHHS